MSNLREHSMKAGIVAVLIVAALVVFFLLRAQPGAEIGISFNDARGLKVGDAVYFKGLKVGSVKSLDIEGGKVAVGVTLDSERLGDMTGRIGFLIGTDNLLLGQKAIYALRYDEEGEGIQPDGTYRGFNNRAEFMLEAARHASGKKLDELKKDFDEFMKGVFE